MGEKMTAPDRDPFAFELQALLLHRSITTLGVIDGLSKQYARKNALNAIIRPLLFPSFAHSPA